MEIKALQIMNKLQKHTKMEAVSFQLCYVYLVGESSEGPTKIGVAHNIPSRIKELQTGNPRKLKCYGARPFLTAEEAFAFEAELHKTFSGRRMIGEWFDLSFKMIARKVRHKYGEPSKKEELVEQAILRGIVKMPKNSI